MEFQHMSDRMSVKASGEARAQGPVGLINTGLVNGDVVLAPVRLTVSGYLHQVRRLAADRFEGREQELAAMAAFCTAPDEGVGTQGLWWRWLAPAWAGKTALMTQFVLNPPADTVVVSFFITARLAGQNNRAAFCEVVQRQLYDLLGEEEPLVTEHTRDEVLLHVLERAAERCASHGQRLVLVVDGLDEDRGVDAEGGGHSIAALLPATPPHGARIVVAGRPHPPIPSDVADGHPLRMDVINRPLERSSFAAAVRVEAENALDALLTRGGAACELLGLVAAAGGGLSSDDLAQLANTRPLRVRRALAGVTGRLFRTSSGVWDRAQESYLLAHEEIQNAALELLAETELAAYRERIHAWADHYRSSAWPADTPEYLLRGYPQLLRTTSNADRLVALASDPARHQRLWHTSGSNLDALTEITSAFEALRAHAGPGGPDISAALVLAIRRDLLHHNSSNIPVHLVTTWALLGHTDRSINIALAYNDVHKQARALTRAAYTLARSGKRHSAAMLANTAVDASLTIADPGSRDRALGEAATAQALAGQYDRALRTARDIKNSDWGAGALIGVARAMSETGERDEAVRAATEAARVARSITAKPWQDRTLQEAAIVLAETGQLEQALDLANSLTNHALRSEASASVARAAVERGWYEPVPGIPWAGHPDNPVRTIAEPASTPAPPEYKQILDIARSTDDPGTRADMLAEAACAMATAGVHKPAAELAATAATTAHSIVAPRWRARAQSAAAKAMAGTGAYERAVEAANAITEAAWRDQALSDVAQSVIAAGRYEQAREIARAIDNPATHSRALAEVAHAMAQAGQHEEASNIAESITAPRSQVEALGHIACALANCGQGEQAIAIARRISTIGSRIETLAEDRHLLAQAEREESSSIGPRIYSQPHIEAGPLVDVTLAIAETGRHEEALEIARSIGDGTAQARAVGGIARAVAQAGQVERALEICRSIGDGAERRRTLGGIARAVAQAGQVERALEICRSIGWKKRLAREAGGSWSRAKVPAEAASGVACAIAEAGRVEQALEIARSIPQTEKQIAALSAIGHVAAELGRHGDAMAIHAEVLRASPQNDPVLRTQLLIDAATAMARADQAEEALTLVDEAVRTTHAILERGSRPGPLIDIARAMAQAGHHKKALEIARAIPNAATRIRALAGIANVHGRSTEGRSMLAEVLQTSPWLVACDALPLLAPEAVAAAAHCLREQEVNGSMPFLSARRL
ncbi:hypothetical protein ACS0VI_09085 [Streptomyces sp. H28]|uniref:hypothetical protein n=1 Tax=Streptomyces sp. H28 TaxID=2775865 RepID=UPI003EC5CF40